MNKVYIKVDNLKYTFILTTMEMHPYDISAVLWNLDNNAKLKKMTKLV